MNLRGQAPGPRKPQGLHNADDGRPEDAGAVVVAHGLLERAPDLG